LSAAFTPASVPCNTERLQPASGHCDKVLLQGRNAEGESNLVIMQSTVRAVRPHHEFSSTLEEARSDSFFRELGIIKLAEHRRSGRGLHCQLVMRAIPSFEFSLMTFSTGTCADEGRTCHQRL
jgi:hypothetical protein